MDNTCAALTGVAANMRTCQAKMIAQKMDEESAVFDISGNSFAVDGELDGGHVNLLKISTPIFFNCSN